MSQKTKWVKADGGEVYQVVDVEIPEERELVVTGRNDGETDPAAVDASKLVPSVYAPGGEFLGRSHAGADAAWVIAKLACGAHAGESCGCGCNHAHAITILSAERAVVWLVQQGVPEDLWPGGLKHVDIVV